MPMEKTTRKSTQLKTLLRLMLINVLQLEDHQNVFHGAENSSYSILKCMNNHVYSHSFLLPSKSNLGGCFSLTLTHVRHECVSSLSLLLSEMDEWTHLRQQSCSCEKYCPGTSPFLLSGSAPEDRSFPWFLPEVCHRDAVPSPTLP